MNAAPESPNRPWEIVGERLRLLGKPTSCRGTVYLRNHSSEKLRIKRIPLAASKRTGSVEIPASHLQVFARLLPGTEVQALAWIDLPEAFPPGKYAVDALVGESRVPVILDVLESWDIALIPEVFSLKPAVGERVVRTMQITNRGNMPWEIPPVVQVPLHRQQHVYSSLFLALKGGGDGSQSGYERVLNDFCDHMKKAVVVSAKIKVISKSPILPPGATQEVDLEITLPADVKQDRLYSGSVFFENTSLLLDIELRGKSTTTKTTRKELKP